MAMAIARQAIMRQVQQSALAVGIAALALVTMVPLGALARGAATVADEYDLPLGPVGALIALTILMIVCLEELNIAQVHGSASAPWQLARVVFAQVALWTVALVLARRLGAEDFSFAPASIVLSPLVSMAARPIAACLKMDQTCAKRIQRSARELKLAGIRFGVVSVGLTVVIYLYVTVFTHLTGVMEFAVLGFAMPLLQAVCMIYLARLMRRHQTAVERIRAAKRQAHELASSTVAVAACAQSATAGPSSILETTQKSAAMQEDRPARFVLIIATGTEAMYALSVGVALLLTESEQTFYLSLVSMLCIEIVQVAVHVKARRVVSRVVAENAGLRLKLDDVRLRQWLLHQELGEKVDVLLALGLVSSTRALGPDVPVMRALDDQQLYRRALAMVLLELLSDVAKDLVSRALCLVPEGQVVDHVVLSRLAATIVVIVSVDAGLLAQAALALGST